MLASGMGAVRELERLEASGRRGAGYGGQRRPLRGPIGSGGPPGMAAPIVEFATGTFTRASAGWYFPTSATQASVGNNVLRTLDDPADTGPMPLFEGARTNSVGRSEQFSNAAWVKVGVTVTANVATVAPDGTTEADRLTYTASATDAISYTFNGTAADNNRAVCSVWLRTEGGTKALRLRIVGKDLSTTDQAITVTNAWQRFVVTTASVGAGAVQPIFTILNDAGATAGGVVAWGAMGEMVGTSSVELYADSYIETTGDIEATRPADSLTWSAGNATAIYAALNAGAFTFLVAPYWGSTLVATRVLISRDANNEVRFMSSAGAVVRVAVGGVTMVTSNVLTFSAHQVMRVTCDPIAGSISIVGATTGDGTVVGTPWSIAASSLRVGGRNAGAGELFGRMGEIYAA